MDTPMLEKMATVKDKSQVCGEFLDWLLGKGWVLAVYHQHGPGCYTPDDEDQEEPACGYVKDQLAPVAYRSIEDLLAEFFEVDLDQVEREKRAILTDLQSRGERR